MADSLVKKASLSRAQSIAFVGLTIALIAVGGVYSGDIIMHWLKTFIRRVFSQQFKRSCIPDGPKVGSVSLSPRGDWRMPSDAHAEAWLDI